MKALSVFVASLVLGFVISAAAQAPAPVAAPPQDELVTAWIDTAKLAAQLANSQCQQLEAVKQFQRVQADTLKKVEARMPGYTVNWATFAVERKTVTPPAAAPK
jgi:hypothetical protein